MLNRGFTALLLLSLTARSDPFVGTWKLDPKKSTLVDEMTVEAAGPNTYKLIFSGDGTETVVANGTDQPGLGGTTVALVVAAPDSWTVVRKKDGHTLITGVWKLSSDGKTLRDHFTQYPTDGTPSSVDYLYNRTAGQAGFVGSWESTTASLDAFELRIEPWETGGLSFATSAAQRMQRLKFDGRDYPDVGKDAIAGITSSGRRVNKQTLEITQKLRGKLSIVRRVSLSPDYKTLTMAIYQAGRSKPNVLWFDRE